MPEVYWAVSVLSCSKERYRIARMRSSSKRSAPPRHGSSQSWRTSTALKTLAESLSLPRNHPKERLAVEDATNAAIAGVGATRGLLFEVTGEVRYARP